MASNLTTNILLALCRKLYFSLMSKGTTSYRIKDENALYYLVDPYESNIWDLVL